MKIIGDHWEIEYGNSSTVPLKLIKKDEMSENKRAINCSKDEMHELFLLMNLIKMSITGATK